MPAVSGKADERRRGWRYPVSIDVGLGKGTGVSRDVSASGMYFETDASLAPGQHIAFSFTLDKVYPHVQLTLQCTGKIVRVEQRGKRLGVAVTIDSWSFKPSHYAGGQAGAEQEGEQSVSG
jgi:PilZ domain